MPGWPRPDGPGPPAATTGLAPTPWRALSHWAPSEASPGQRATLGEQLTGAANGCVSEVDYASPMHPGPENNSERLLKNQSPAGGTGRA